MSAWIVDKDEIDLLVTAVLVLRNGGRPLKPDEATLKTAEAIGQEFMDENYRSVNYRYNENEVPPAYHFSPVGELLGDPAQIRPQVWRQVVESAHCLDYQSCEHSGWTPSVACGMVLEITESEPAKAIGCCGGDTKWGWTRWDGFPE